MLVAASACIGSARDANALGTCELGPLVFGDDVWETDRAEFWEKYRRYRFRWTNKSMNVAYFHGKRTPLTSYGKRLAAARVLFRDRHIARIELLAYDEAVDGKIPKSEFEQFFTQIRDTIGIYSGRGNPGITVNDTATGTRRELWVNDTTAFLLEFRYQSVSPQYARQFRGDFIRLTTAPREEATSLRTQAKPKIARLRHLRENVRRRGNTLYIENIPMCIKGESSSSEAASAEMLFSYLKMPIDQREIAATMSADSSQQGPFTALRTSLIKLAPPRVFSRNVIREFDWKRWRRLLNDYNLSARASGRPSINNGRSRNPDVALRKMDVAWLKKSLARGQTITKFHNDIKRYLVRGVPILWGVQLGIVPESDIPLSYYDDSEEDRLASDSSQKGDFLASNGTAARKASHSRTWVGKHMRLIVGYDADTREVLYTDPWGEQHTRKRMSLVDANAITLSLYAVQPRF